MKWLTPKQVAESLGFSNVESVYALIRSGDLPAIDLNARGKKGHRYKIDPIELAEFKENRRVKPSAPKKLDPDQAHSSAPVTGIIRFARAARGKSLLRT